MKKDYLTFKDGFTVGLPIVIGYLPIAATFGILAKTMGVNIIDCFLFSALVFAGSSQFMALNLLSTGAGTAQIILTTLLVNFRHFLMSASMATELRKTAKKLLPCIAFTITDESFAVVSLKSEKKTEGFILALQLFGYVAWVGGTVLGYLVGELLPPILSDSMGIAIYAMFISILIPEVKKSFKVGGLVLLSGLINTVLSNVKLLPQGWNIIFAIVFSSAIGTYFLKKRGIGAYE